MIIRKQSQKHTEVAIFKIHIDFNYEATQKHQSLRPGGKYRFPCKHDDKWNEASYEDIVDFVTQVINDELVRMCNKCNLLSVNEIKVIKASSGSINILFSAIVNTLGVISGLKDLYDCIELISELAEIHVKKRLEETYGDNFVVNTSIVAPQEKRHDYCKPCAKNTNHSITSDSSKRDAFFYYLLISNLVLLTIIILLVYKAVITVYW